MERPSSGNCQKIKFCDFLGERLTSLGGRKSAGAISENTQIKGTEKLTFLSST